MINAYEMTLLSQLQDYWDNTVTANIGTPDDIIPYIFANLPADGPTGTNHKAIGEELKKLSTGNTTDDVKFLLQFPAIKGHVPSVTIEVGNEEEMEVVGSFVEENYNQDIGKWETAKGGVFNKQYAIGVFTFNADTTLYLYSIVKYGLLLLRDNLDQSSNYLIKVRPMAIDNQRFSPDVVYYRYIDIVVEGLLDSAIERFGQVKQVGVDATTKTVDFSTDVVS
jgi:hypothetical protein